MPIAKLQSVTSIIISMSYEYVLDVCAGSTEVQKIISFHFFYFLPVWGKFENFLWFCVLCKTSGRAETSENSAIIIIYIKIYHSIYKPHNNLFTFNSFNFLCIN